MFKVEVTYTSGMEVFEIPSSEKGQIRGSAGAIVEALRLSNLNDRRKGTYRTVIKVEVLSQTF